MFLDLHFDLGGLHGTLEHGGNEVGLSGWSTAIGGMVYLLSDSRSSDHLGVGAGAFYVSDVSNWDLTEEINEVRFSYLKVPLMVGHFHAESEVYYYLAGGAYFSTLGAGQLDPESGSTVYYESADFWTAIGLRAECGFGLLMGDIGTGFGGCLWLEVDLLGPLSGGDDSMHNWKLGLGLSLPIFF